MFSTSANRLTKILPVVLVVLSFALISGQYLYSIISAMRLAKSANVPRPSDPGYVLEYIGFQESSTTPIGQRAMVAHVLVFVIVLPHRVAVKWAQKTR